MAKKQTIKKRILKRTMSLAKMREKWKGGYTEKVAEPAIGTKSSIRTFPGGLPGSGQK